MRWKALVGSLLVSSALLPGVAMSQVDLAPYLKKDGFGDVQLSPDGQYLAATVPREDRTGIVVLRRKDMSKSAAFSLGPNTHISTFNWVNGHRLLVSMAEQFGTQDTPTPTGELYGIDADGGRAEMLVGFRVEESGLTRIKTKKEEDVSAFLVDDLPHDDRHVIIAAWPFSSEPWSRAERMDVQTGRRVVVARAPVPRASYSTDHAGVVRFARGSRSDNASKLYHRPSDDAEWTLVSDESATGRFESVIGFAADNRIAYLLVEEKEGPDAVVAYDTSTGERRQLLRDQRVDPYQVLDALDGRTPAGVLFSGSRTRSAFFDETSDTARLYRMLEGSFQGQGVVVDSVTRDGKLAVVQVWNARNPGDFYLFDVSTKRAEHMLASLGWFDPDQMADVRPVTYKARDGLEIDGFLTVPGKSEGALPLVLMPHGGPFDIFDAWAFDVESQLLAKAGYAVLKVNYRGSGNRGRAFKAAGARQWGGKMQDDLADAVQWAVEQKIADPARVCIVGGSYGGYAAMAGLALTPELFKCGVGYVGVYDLEKMVAEDSRNSRSSATWLREWVGEGDMLRKASATMMVDRIKAPVLLVAGGEDRIAPIAHSRAMERGLKDAGTPVETLYVASEGHGFYEERNRRAYYTALLDFLSRHLGGQPAMKANRD